MRYKIYTVLFFIKKQKLLKNGRAPICMRITYDGKRVETNIQRSILPEDWDQVRQRAKSKDLVSQDLNGFILQTQTNLSRVWNRMVDEGRIITPELLRDQLMILQKSNGSYLLQEFALHNRKIRQRVGIDYAEITVKRYECITRRLREFIVQKYSQDDILFKDIDRKFIEEFIVFLKIEKLCAQNTVIRYIKCLKKIVNMALANEWISKNPIYGIVLRAPIVNNVFLTKDELLRIINKKLTIERMELVKDIFIFSCFTGLSFIDVRELETSNIVKDNSGNMWIHITRKKTSSQCYIPILDIPKQVIEKYKDHPRSIRKGKCLPVPYNQNMNSYLKEIADCCEIPKQITTHTARRTFASVVTTANKVPIETVSKMMGHADLRMTIKYTHVFDDNVLKEMQRINDIFR